ncbi:type VI secretion system-associated protein VasI [Pasteurella sp. PK-2025]|uniref:type VI secretion system-associated protein VasI n=1 Tax=unclassified Pasteurella TaxID=2621516 RepID=UPI003C76FBA2
MRPSLISTNKAVYYTSVILVAHFSLLTVSASAVGKPHYSADSTLKAMELCRQEKSSLERLDCYDNAWKVNMPRTALIEEKKGGVAWQRAMDNESNRDKDTFSLLTKSYNIDGNNPTIIITTPALGYKGTRPVLMLSCIDNITRLQIALTTPSGKRDTDVEISTDKNKFETRWFFRENGFLLESSRGLEGITEIQRLLKSNTLKIKSNVSSINGLTFNIRNLEQEIKSLRAACHW